MNCSPCYRCEDRRVGCHASCPKYLQFKKDNEAARKKIFNEKELRCALANVAKTKKDI